MGQIKKAVYKVDNGTDFDTIHFETEASMVKMASGRDVEAQLEEIMGNQHMTFPAHKELPGGTILQWDFITVYSGSTYNVSFPIEFPGNAEIILATVVGGNPQDIYVSYPNTKGCQISVPTGENSPQRVNYLAIGY